MALNKPMTGSNREYQVLKPDTYPVRLVQVIDCGVQAQRAYMGQDKDPAEELALTYEFVDEFMLDEDGQPDPSKPRWITEFIKHYSREAEKSKAANRLVALDPTNEHGENWDRLLGAPAWALVVVNTNEKTKKQYENIQTLTTMRTKEAVRMPDLVNAPRIFDFDEPDMEVFAALPKFIQKRIKEALNFKGSKLEGLLQAIGEPVPEKSADVEEAENPY